MCCWLGFGLGSVSFVLDTIGIRPFFFVCVDYCGYFCGKIRILKVWFDLIYFTNIFDGVGGGLKENIYQI